MLKLHILGYHKLHASVTAQGVLRAHIGFHCSRCHRSWYPNGRQLMEEAGRRPDDYFEGLTFIGRMTTEGLKQFLRDLEDRQIEENAEFARKLKEQEALLEGQPPRPIEETLEGLQRMADRYRHNLE
ncbi:MAG: hypothetical protein FIB01_15810 [Gemmatimonadetes bacterium]|nr:hypothetical protein [Gemmatimonadota bacterium]